MSESANVRALATIDAVSATIGSAGSAFYFTPETLAKGKEYGLDAFHWYFLGRGGVLGDVESSVVLSAFGYFQPDLLSNMWNSAKESMNPREAGSAFMGCCGEFGALRLGGDGAVDSATLDAFNQAAETVSAAADPSGLALFAGISAEKLAADSPSRAMQNTAILRELRGSVHLLALVASGVASPVAHAINRPNEIELFGYKEAPEIGPNDKANVAKAETLTSELLIPAFSALDEQGAADLIAGTKAIGAALA